MKPDERFSGGGVDVLHDLHLGKPLGNVTLVDGERIDPDDRRLVSQAQTVQNKIEILRYVERLSVKMDPVRTPEV